tara:strand:- start:816 stop:1286 length:471 start_codon:yes stop_codon:yes gene_type:complete
LDATASKTLQKRLLYRAGHARRREKMNIDLKEIRKMVTVALIQERVGYYGHQVDGDAGQASDPPQIEEMIDEAEQQVQNSEASARNIALAAIAKAVHDLVGPLFKAGLQKDILSPILKNFNNEVVLGLRRAEELKRKEAEEAKAEVVSQTLATGGE